MADYDSDYIIKLYQNGSDFFNFMRFNQESHHIIIGESAMISSYHI